MWIGAAKLLPVLWWFLRMYYLGDMKTEHRNIIHYTSGKHSHSSKEMWKKTFIYIRAIPYIHDHTTYEWKEAQKANLSKSLILKALSIKLWLYFGTLSVIWNHGIHYCFQKTCTFTPSSMVQFMIGYLSTKEYGVVPSFADSRFDQVICALKLLEFWLRDRERRWIKISWLSCGKKFTGMHLYGKRIISEYSHNLQHCLLNDGIVNFAK